MQKCEEVENRNYRLFLKRWFLNESELWVFGGREFQRVLAEALSPQVWCLVLVVRVRGLASNDLRPGGKGCWGLCRWWGGSWSEFGAELGANEGVEDGCGWAPGQLSSEHVVFGGWWRGGRKESWVMIQRRKNNILGFMCYWKETEGSRDVTFANNI